MIYRGYLIPYHHGFDEELKTIGFVMQPLVGTSARWKRIRSLESGNPEIMTAKIDDIVFEGNFGWSAHHQNVGGRKLSVMVESYPSDGSKKEISKHEKDEYEYKCGLYYPKANRNSFITEIDWQYAVEILKRDLGKFFEFAEKIGQ